MKKGKNDESYSNKQYDNADQHAFWESEPCKCDIGQQGSEGPYCPEGPHCPEGPQGPIGPQGPAGPKGAIGAQGPIGPQGAIGHRGATGPRGATGSPGSAFKWAVQANRQTEGTVERGHTLVLPLAIEIGGKDIEYDNSTGIILINRVGTYLAVWTFNLEPVPPSSSVVVTLETVEGQIQVGFSGAVSGLVAGSSVFQAAMVNSYRLVNRSLGSVRFITAAGTPNVSGGLTIIRIA